MARVGIVSAVKLALSGATLADLWDRLAEAYGTRIVFTLDEPLRLHVMNARELTYEDVLDVVSRVAGGFAAAGVRRGDRVAICTANRIEYALFVFAAARAGAVAVPLHHHLREPEIVALVKQSKARVVVSDLAVKIKGVTCLRTGDLDRLAAGASRLPAAKIGAEDPVAILYTSGTTGVPKGATLTSRSLLAVARLAALVPDASQERGVCGLPLAHVMGLATLLFHSLAGAPMHWFGKFDAERVLETIVEKRATFFIGVPAMYAMMAEAGAEEHDLSSVKLWASGADAMPPALVERFRNLGCALRSPLGQRLFTAAFAEIYGMVELSGPAILKLTLPVPVGTLSARVRNAASRAASWVGHLPGLRGLGGDGPAALGIPIPPYRVKIVGDDGKPVKAGVVGELLIRGPGVTKGYDAMASPLKDGWLSTGDLARKNRLGLIAFSSRKKDVVKHGGFSVYPAEVEAQLSEHPAIAEAVVFGAPHPTKGAVPVAVVALAKGKRATEKELLDWARETIAPFKAPRALAIVDASEIPRNANRKVLKDELREKMLPKIAPRIKPS